MASRVRIGVARRKKGDYLTSLLLVVISLAFAGPVFQAGDFSSTVVVGRKTMDGRMGPTPQRPQVRRLPDPSRRTSKFTRMRRPFSLTFALAMVLLFSVVLIPSVRAATGGSYDAAADFSPSLNPNGVWSYGWSSTRGSPFNLYPAHFQVSGLDVWAPAVGDLFGSDVFHNGGSVTINPAGTNPIPPGQLAFHPGAAGQNGIVRWTAPSTGLYDVSASFIGLDTYGTTTDVAVLHNSYSKMAPQLFVAFVLGYNDIKTFSTAVFALAADTIDFTVGFGSDGNYFDDSTGISVVITQVDPLGALWHFDEGTGATTVDSTGHTTAGTLNGPSWVVPSGARFGRALDFDGVDDYVSVPTSSEITPTNAITVEAWIDGDTLTTSFAAVAKRIGSEDVGYALEMNTPGNRICFWVFTDAWRGACPNDPSATDTSTPISTGAWHHIAGTYDGSSVKSYLDCAVQYSLAVTGDIHYGTSGITDLAIGRDPIRSGERFFDGRIDEVRIWKRALTSGEIGESFALGEAANNANYDTILTHQAGFGVFIFTSAFHRVDGSDNIKFRLMGVDVTAAISGSVGTNGITARRVTPKGGTWTLDSVILGSPAATERDIDPGIPGGSPTAKGLILTANLGDGTKLGFALHTTPL